MDQYFSQLIILAKLYFFNRFAYSDTTLPSGMYLMYYSMAEYKRYHGLATVKKVTKIRR